MAIYFLNIKTLGRANGSAGNSATSAAAYRAAERIHDERTGRTHNHSQRLGVLHKQIVLPSKFMGIDLPWAQNRASLWNAAEKAEVRSDARVAREYVVALPAELSPQQRLGLVQTFAQTISDRYQNAVDVAIHEPRPGGDPRNFHAHLLTTTREVTSQGLGLKTTLDIQATARQQRGLAPLTNEFLWVREHWATLANSALREAGVEARIDHRSLAEQGLDREPRPRIPTWAREIERRGEKSIVAERLREQHHQDSHARLERSAAGPPVEDKAAAFARVIGGLQNIEDIRRQARERWLSMRGAAEAGSPERHAADLASGATRQSDDDLAIS